MGKLIPVSPVVGGAAFGAAVATLISVAVYEGRTDVVPTVADATPRVRETDASDFNQDQLDAMAEGCEFGSDTIAYRLGEPPRLPAEELDVFDLSPAQVAAVNTAVAAENKRLVAAIRGAYVELTGDEATAIQVLALASC